jgi:1-acyl-sn-glycerol-3-phosphate acyltransferase
MTMYYNLDSTGNNYFTSRRPLPVAAIISPSLYFYIRLAITVITASRVAKAGKYDGKAWSNDSFEVLQELEDAGMKISISGLAHLNRLREPAVIIGNHMSMMETVLLPSMIRPIRPVTFVVKESLLEYPIFKHVMRARRPIAVTRTNPRQDLKTVLEEGTRMLGDGISIIVFPQTTRDHSFDPSQMSTIGVKLAKKAGVPVVPLALKTDGWRNGKKFKDFGQLDRSRVSYFCFGEPFQVEGKGLLEHEKINRFILDHLRRWTR